MNILWIPQISTASKDGKVLLDCDSNMSVLERYMHSDFSENNIDVAFEFSDFNAIVPYDFPGKFVISDLHCGKFTNAGCKHRFIFNRDRYFSNAKMERYAYDNDFFERINVCRKKEGNQCGYDVVFVNEPTKTHALRLIFKDSIIATYMHWYAYDNMPELQFCQLDGLRAADIVFVNSNYIKGRLECQYKNLCIKAPIIEVLPPAFDVITHSAELDAKLLEFIQAGSKDRAIIYNHRLSGDKYYKKGFESFVKIYKDVAAMIGRENMPLVYFTNPSGKDVDLKSYDDNFICKHFDCKKDYYKFIGLNGVNKSRQCFIHINSFFESQGMWAISTAESVAAGLICLIPNKFGYVEIMHKSSDSYCDTIAEMTRKLSYLLTTKDREFIFNYIGYAGKDSISNNHYVNLSSSIIGKKLNVTLNQLVFKKHSAADSLESFEKVLIIASGGFDPLHQGHIEYLEKAKSLGDTLICIANKDSFLLDKKGYVFMPLSQRVNILKSLKCIDDVVISCDCDQTVCRTIKALYDSCKDDGYTKIIFAKGGDRTAEEIPEAKICMQLGIEIVDGLGEKIESSSRLVDNAKHMEDKNV